MAFCGLSHSYEQFYQAVRRCWRYGQTQPVSVDVVVSDQETAIVANVISKRDASDEMKDQMTRRSMRIRTDESMTARDSMPYMVDAEHGENWDLLLGDCVERIKEIPDGCVGYTIFSPPFASLYTYSNSDRDMGNCKTDEEFAEHFAYLIPELYRVTAPGRLLSFHCMNLPTTKERDGYIGIRDFRGDLIREFQKAGFIYHSEVCIWKDPVTAMQRTKALGLLNKASETAWSMLRAVNEASDRLQDSAENVIVSDKKTLEAINAYTMVLVRTKEVVGNEDMTDNVWEKAIEAASYCAWRTGTAQKQYDQQRRAY